MLIKFSFVKIVIQAKKKKKKRQYVNREIAKKLKNTFIRRKQNFVFFVNA